MSSAGDLDRRVTLQSLGAAVDDGFRTEPGALEYLCDVWAQFIPLTATERSQAEQTTAALRARYKFRRDSSWSNLNALNGLHDNRTGQDFDISGVSEPQRGWLIAECVARAD